MTTEPRNPPEAIDLIIDELDRIGKLPNAAEIAAIEADNSLNDRIAISLAYLGRAAAKVQRNEREGAKPVENLVKAAAIICAAINAELKKPEGGSGGQDIHG